MNRKPATNLHVRHITTEFSSKHSQLPVDRWETATEHETFPSGTFTNIRTVGYARDYHLIDPRLYIREFPVASAFAGALLAMLTVTTVLVIMSAPIGWCVAAAVLCIPLLMATCPMGVAEYEDNGSRLNRTRKVIQISGHGGKDARDAHRNDPTAAMKCIRVLAKSEDETTSEAKDLAANILHRLAETQRELDKEEAFRKEAEADALKAFDAAAAVAPVVDRSDELDLTQLSAELELQGK